MIRKPSFKLSWKYALGEIILIFIGISLAIAFQNWNDNRKLKALEKELLADISRSLARDHFELTQIRDSYRLAEQAAAKVLAFDGSPIQKDSLPIWLGQFINFERFNPASSPYEVLKSAGLQTVSNKRVRSLIADYYDDSVPKIVQALYDVEEDFENNAVSFFRDKFEDFKFKEYAIPKDIDAFMNDPSNLIYFKIFRDNRAGAIDDLDSGIGLNEMVNFLIVHQLESNK